LRERQIENPLWYEESKDDLKPQKVIEMVHEITNGDAIVTTDVGQHQMWAAQFYPFKKPNRLVTSGGLGTMGFGLPAAIGAQLAEKDTTVVAFLGDGGFQMTLQELGVIRELNLPVKVIILNNKSLGMVRQWQEIFYEERYSHSLIPNQPNIVKLAEAYDIKGYEASTEEEAAKVLQEAFSHDEPAVLNIHIAPGENVYPMVAPGKGLHEMVGVKP
jgi:acetolactate synthase-1/2/3 large subunit